MKSSKGLLSTLFQGFNFNYMSGLFSSKIDWFHCFSCSFMAVVLCSVVMMNVSLLISDLYYKNHMSLYQPAEFFCSLMPSMILGILMMPSLGLLYESSFMNYWGGLSIGVMGHQWYWSYEYGDHGEKVSFDSYMLPSDEMSSGSVHLLDVDNRSVVPVGMNVSFLIGSEDVIHSWSLPSMSVKVDALSGVLSQVVCNFPLVGVYYGQCSEICGAFHSFMPIVVESCLSENFINWVVGMS
uniref:Cytochrome c oxidase subunit 2 n=1 Tax=Philometroides sanguineus TaxID=378106 RepID=A0A0U1V611_9BILA|nr:cytochrome c oxidase subunit II [Philometroides sanguineus]AIN37108.1 cytochrome c oxidase subunit II [Philometroides sanguineus]